MTHYERTADFLISVPNRPGELARFVEALESDGITLRAVSGYGLGGGNAELVFVPDDADRFAKFCDGHGVTCQRRPVIGMSGDAHLGALMKAVDALARADINVRWLDATAVDGRFSAFLMVAEEDLDRAEGVLRG